MDGIKKTLASSMQWRLSIGISAAITVFACGAGFWSFASAYQEANEFQDGLLRQASRLVQSGHLLSSEIVATPSAAHPEERIVVRMLPLPGEASNADGNLNDLPIDLPDGLQTLSVNGELWRVFIDLVQGEQRVVVGQLTAERDEIAFDSGMRTIVPMALLCPFLCWLVCILVRRTLRPVNDLSEGLDRRTGWDLHVMPLDKSPSEIRPFVIAINNLFGRLERAAEIQRRFVADAAHELRSPLMALSVQIENASGAMEPNGEQLVPARQGIARLQSLLEQLLSLARVQADDLTIRPTMPLQPILRKVVQDLIADADKRGVEISVSCAKPVAIAAQAIELTLILRNILDNAIRYGRQGGIVDVDVHASVQWITISVTDDGPGITEEDHERAFDPFYRGSGMLEGGSGLGLSIVRTIVERLGGVVDMEWADMVRKRGLRVTVRVPTGR
jgi:two-component system, OmpR family, sensor kinase